jgi:hypothetical protein
MLLDVASFISEETFSFMTAWSLKVLSFHLTLNRNKREFFSAYSE